MKYIVNFFALLLLYLVSPFNVHSEELPLWELGLGFGGLHQACYTGTNQTCSYTFPVILPVYRGDFFKADDEGLRAQLFQDDRYELDFSVDFNFPIDSDEVDLRRGMPDIGSLLQVGPSFEMVLTENKNNQWLLKLPLRAAFEIDDRHIHSRGYNFSPALAVDIDFDNTPLTLGIAFGLNFGNREYNAVYYGVDDEFATFSTLDRPAYEASTGYAGARLQIALTSKTVDNLMVIFLRYDTISGAVFDDSPLVETHENITVGFLYSHYLVKSKKLVEF